MHLLKLSCLGVRISTYEFWGNTKHSDHSKTHICKKSFKAILSIIILFVKCLRCATCSTHHFRITTTSLWDRYTWGNWGTERSSNLSRTPQRICKRAMLQIKTLDTTLILTTVLLDLVPSAAACANFYSGMYLIPGMECLTVEFTVWMWVLRPGNWASYILPVLLVGTTLVIRNTNRSGYLSKLLWNVVCFSFITLSSLVAIFAFLILSYSVLTGIAIQTLLLWHDPRVETLLSPSLVHEILPLWVLSLQHHIESLLMHLGLVMSQYYH